MNFSTFYLIFVLASGYFFKDAFGVEEGYISSDCQPGSERASWAKGHEEAIWENWRRKRTQGERADCEARNLRKLSKEQLNEQHRMFAVQESHRKAFNDARVTWFTSDASKDQKEQYVFFMCHPRKLHKFPQCLHLGLVHQVMNLECEINLAILLRRTLLPFPLVEDETFSGCRTRYKRFGSILNLSSYPVDESVSWSKANNSFVVSMDPDSLIDPAASSSQFIALGRGSKERQSNFCVEYAW
jgi:hypothetical protein